VHPRMKCHLGTRVLAIDGNLRLQAALRAQRARESIQRSKNQNRRKLLAQALAHVREEPAQNYRRML
jgi:hypothetical protein